MTHKLCWLKKMIYVLSLLMSLLIAPSFAADKLTVTPTEAQIGTTRTQTFSVAGGEEPYIWQVVGNGSLDIDSGNTVKYTAAKSTGKDRLFVMDSKGVSAEVNIAVNGTLLITPSNVVLPPNGTKIFSVSGGVGKVRFTATLGTITSSGEYTAPANLGIYTITATDEAENTATVTVSVNNSPTVTPAQAWVDRDGSIKFDVVGGRPPFAWHTTAGTIDVSGTNVTFKAPSESITATVTVTDNAGQTSTSTVYVDIPLRATKQVVYAAPGEKIRVAVTGGLPSFDWAAGNGEMDKVNTDNGYNYFTAPKIMGETVIHVRDRKANTTEVKVYLTKPIKVTPYVGYMKRGETRNFTVVSGVPPYTARVVDGDGTLSPDSSEDGRFTYTASNVADKDIIIEFSDNAGQIVHAHAYVEREIHLSSGTTLYVDKGSKAKFKISGGTGGYYVEASSGLAEVDPETGLGTYESPNSYGEYTLTVIDSSDQTKEFVMKVERMVPVILPLTATMAAGETKTFMVTRGVPLYEWNFQGGLVEAQNDKKSVVEVAAPKTAGTYKLTVEDSAGNQAEATVIADILNQPPKASFTISPNQGNAPLTVQLDATASTDDGNIVKYQWASSDGQNAEGIKTSLTFSQIGTHNITLTVTDNEAATASNIQTVTVNEKPLPPPVEGIGQAIIIAAGGAEPDNTLFKYSNEFTQRFYRLIKQRGFEDENIYYMNPHAPDIDLDGYLEEDKHDYKLFDPALELKEAFQQAASKLQAGQQFIFFLHGHARPNNFRIKPDYELSANNLSDLLATLPAGVQQIIILDSCYSGSFFDKLSGIEERILISSADNTNLAWNTKSESFTDTFLRSLGRGLNLTDAFKQAEKLIIQDKQLFGNQRPWLDDDANGLYNSGDGRRAAKIQLGKEGIHAAPPPIISEVHQRQELAKDVNNATLWLRTTPDVDGILKVRATIINPQFVSQKYEGPETNFGRNELQLIYNPAQKRYEIVYEGFKTAGTWRILYQAQSKEGIWSDIVQSEVQSQGSSKIATIKVGLNLSRYKITEPLRLNLQLDGQTEADLYLAIILPDKSFITFSYPSTPSYPNEAKIYQTIKIAGPKNYTANINLPSKQGQYSTCGVLVQQAAEPLELENWIDFNCEGFEVY